MTYDKAKARSLPGLLRRAVPCSVNHPTKQTIGGPILGISRLLISYVKQSSRRTFETM
jgi:hypothetical protein